MAEDIQDFRGDDCARLLPQGSVLSRQRYVQISVFEEAVDVEALKWEEDDGSLILSPQKMFVGIVGIPLWWLDPDEGATATMPMKVPSARGEELVIGTDLAFLPGLPTTTYGPETMVLDVFEKDLNASTTQYTAREGNIRTVLDPPKLRKLLRNGELRVRHDSGRDLILKLHRQPAAKDLDSRTGGGAGVASWAGASHNMSFTGGPVSLDAMPTKLAAFALVEAHGGDVCTAIEALRADPRAGHYHDEALTPSSLMAGLADETFAAVLEAFRQHREWEACTRVVRTPEQPVFQIAGVTVLEQVHTLKGLSRGRLVDSVTLGPEESITTEVFTWDRQVVDTEQTFGSEAEQNLTRKLNTSTTAEITSDVHQAVQTGAGGDLGLSLPLESVGAGVDAGVAGDIQTQLDTNNSLRVQQLAEAAVTASERFKATHQVKIVNRRETGTETRTTRTFKNPNVGRVLHLHHFEVQTHYEVVTRVVETQRFGLLVENPPIGPIDRDWVRAHHHLLDEMLLSDPYREGLEAAQQLAAQEWVDELAAAERRAREEEQQRQAKKESGAEPAANFFPNKGIFATARSIQEKLGAFLGRLNLKEAFLTLAQHLNPGQGVSLAKLTKAEQIIARTAWWTQIGVAYPAFHEQAKTFQKKIADLDTPVARQDPETGDAVIAAVGELVSGLDDDWLVAVKLIGAAIVMQLISMPIRLNPLVDLYTAKLLAAPDDLGLPKLLSRARMEHSQHAAKQNAETLAPPAPKPETLTPTTTVPAPPRAYTLKELGEAHAALGRLLAHLEEYRAFYTNEFYKREDPALRMDRLQRLGVAQFIDNRILGFAGTKAIYPLRLAALDGKVRERLLAEYRASPVDPANAVQVVDSISVPTGGITTEAVVGECDVIEEYVQRRRDQELRQRTAEADLAQARAQQARLEAERMKKRLASGDLNPLNLRVPAPATDSGTTQPR